MTEIQLKPTFGALVNAEAELGPLFALVVRAAAGQLTLSELVALFWHCRVEQAEDNREAFSDALTAMGMAALSVPLRKLLGEILQGQTP